MYIVAYFKQPISCLMFNVSFNYFLNTPKFFFFPPFHVYIHNSCCKFWVSCLIFYVHYYRSTHILCSLLHILSNVFHTYCSMFHVIIFQAPTKFSFVPSFHVYVHASCFKFQVLCSLLWKYLYFIFLVAYFK